MPVTPGSDPQPLAPDLLPLCARGALQKVPTHNVYQLPASNP